MQSTLYGYLEVVHEKELVHYFICSLCFYTSADEYDIRKHLVFEHVIVIRVTPVDCLDELTAVNGLPSVRMNTPRFLRRDDQDR